MGEKRVPWVVGKNRIGEAGSNNQAGKDTPSNSTPTASAKGKSNSPPIPSKAKGSLIPARSHITNVEPTIPFSPHA